MVSIIRSWRAALALASCLTAFASAAAPAVAEQPIVNLGPVGPHEPILAVMGTQRILAFYVPDRGECVVDAITWKDAAPDAPARIRISLRPGEMVELASPERRALNLLCGVEASTLTAVAPAEQIATGTIQTR